jgi:hypothetical protein
MHVEACSDSAGGEIRSLEVDATYFKIEHRGAPDNSSRERSKFFHPSEADRVASLSIRQLTARGEIEEPVPWHQAERDFATLTRAHRNLIKICRIQNSWFRSIIGQSLKEDHNKRAALMQGLGPPLSGNEGGISLINWQNRPGLMVASMSMPDDRLQQLVPLSVVEEFHVCLSLKPPCAGRIN